ncbi:NAD-dependent succinate-semialdehyde dehydrogenase [Geodermatophilus sp. CPCC 206100]|uniref:NAD-dependent succinate-semialdehyde dehydrogenase n=1 Tax=Geodermatophilus sp. CPCC 206100 TaxID=3020054 RepID=UPI003AFF666F
MPAYAVTNPATGETVRTYPAISEADLDGAIAEASAAYTSWSRATTPAERAELVRRVGALLTERSQELAEIAVREMGKPIAQAVGEVEFAAEIFRYYADEGPHHLGDEPIDVESGSAVVRKEGLGVLLGVMPWNFPYYQVARFAGPNIVAGNTILLKHAPQCPESSSALEEIFRAAATELGVPTGVYRNILATDEQVAAVIADPRVQGVSVTGSERAGSAVAEVAGRNLTKVVLELGGSDPFILLSTDDLDAAVTDAVNARLDNNGQSCNAAKRFIVTADLYDRFAERFTGALGAVTPADPTDESTTLGPLSSDTASERLQEQLDRAVEQGATVLARGERRGNFFPPAVLADITPEMDAYRQEFFGPVAMLFRAEDEDDAVRLANDTPFGLGSYLYTTDPDQADRVVDRIDAGMVWVNLVLGDAAELPFGGTKRSGFGRELGRYALDEFVNRKLVRKA